MIRLTATGSLDVGLIAALVVFGFGSNEGTAVGFNAVDDKLVGGIDGI